MANASRVIPKSERPRKIDEDRNHAAWRATRALIYFTFGEQESEPKFAQQIHEAIFSYPVASADQITVAAELIESANEGIGVGRSDHEALEAL